MADALLGRAGLCYAVALLGAFALVAMWESWRPLRAASVPLGPRWACNVALLLLNQVVVQVAMPVLGLAAAVMAVERGWGPLNGPALPAALAVPLGVLVLDALRWALHRMLHRWALLWRLHRVHHSDLDYDCSISLRSHPLEALLTQGVLVGAVLLLGLPPMAVLLSDVLTIALGYFAHANVGLPPRVEAVLGRVIVTPDLHRVHHSVRLDESMANFGSVLSIWDRLAGSWRAAPADGALGMQIGLAELRDPRRLTIGRLLLMPLRR